MQKVQGEVTKLSDYLLCKLIGWQMDPRDFGSTDELLLTENMKIDGLFSLELNTGC